MFIMIIWEISTGVTIGFNYIFCSNDNRDTTKLLRKIKVYGRHVLETKVSM